MRRHSSTRPGKGRYNTGRANTVGTVHSLTLSARAAMQCTRVGMGRVVAASGARRLCSTHANSHCTTERAKAELKLRQFDEAVARGGRCRHCWFAQHLCMCGKLEPLVVPTDRVHVTLVMHHREFGKRANTGKLVRSVLPSSSQLLIHSLHETQLSEMCVDPCSVLLWPGEGSVPISEHQARMEMTQPDRRIHLVAVDGRWSQTKSMARRYSRMPRVHIDSAATLPHPSRKQVRPHGSSTAEAVATALGLFGEARASAAIVDALRVLTEHHQETSGPRRTHE